MRRTLPRVALTGLFLAAGITTSAAEHVMALRIASLDAMLADGERIAAAVGETESRRELLNTALVPMGLTDAGWVDGSRPIVFSVPPEGLATMGWVAAVPVTDVATALESLEAQLGDHEAFDDGVHSYLTAFKSPIFVAPADGHLVAGLSRELVAAADFKEVLDVGELPPGNVALDIDLVPMSAMIQLGLAMGRQALVQGDDDDDEAAASQRASLSMFDLYIELVNNAILNTSRVQLSFEVGSEHLMFHKRLLPRPESTLAGLLKAQKRSFPDLARRIDAESAAGVMATDITFTPAFRAATKTFARRYVDAMKILGDSLPEEQIDWFGAMIEPWDESIEQWVDCYRGDMAASYDFGAETGFRVTQLTGLTDGDTCGALLGDAMKMLEQLPGLTEGGSLAEVEPEALVHSGVSATRIGVSLIPPGEGGIAVDAESAEMMNRVLGGDAYVYYLGVSKNVLISTSGAQAEESFKSAVDRLTARTKRGGMGPRQFEPLSVGPGFFSAVDLGRVFRQLADLDPDDSDLAELRELSDGAGRIVLAARLLRNSWDFDLSMPLSFLDALDELDDSDEEGEGDSDHHEADERDPGA